MPSMLATCRPIRVDSAGGSRPRPKSRRAASTRSYIRSRAASVSSLESVSPSSSGRHPAAARNRRDHSGPAHRRDRPRRPRPRALTRAGPAPTAMPSSPCCSDNRPLRSKHVARDHHFSGRPGRTVRTAGAAPPAYPQGRGTRRPCRCQGEAPLPGGRVQRRDAWACGLTSSRCPTGRRQHDSRALPITLDTGTVPASRSPCPEPRVVGVVAVVAHHPQLPSAPSPARTFGCVGG